MGDRTIVSAPGKVLLAGGYLVLDRRYTGLVVATSSRFYCAVKPSASSSPRVTVRAGQFPADASTWSYDVSVSNGRAEVSPLGDAGKNKFVAVTLGQVLRYAVERAASDGPEAVEELRRKLGNGLDIVVLADNDFYSQRESLAAASLPPRLSSLASLTPFCPLPRPIGQTNKTGLGSSAALVTSLVAGILSHLSITSETATIHALAQAAHCVAQGKIGSGFDVASAVFGTHVYRRFSPAILEPLFAELAVQTPGTLKRVVDSEWDSENRPFALPRGLRLMLADVDAGTDTPSFVGKVLAWRKANPEEALQQWTKLDAANHVLEAALARLGELEAQVGKDEYEASLGAMGLVSLSELGPEGLEDPFARACRSVRDAAEDVRAGMRAMSASSGVPIEPAEQTRLLDACNAVEGVLGGGVPGAGGYDAIWVLIVDDDAVAEAVEEVWSSWTEMSVSPLSAAQSDGGLVSVQEGDVRGLSEALARCWN